MDVALVGLAASGKTTVFRALTAGHGTAAADARGEHLGSVKIPDERLSKLGALVAAKKITPLEVTLHDVPAFSGRAAGEASETLSRADALIHVVRAFSRDDLPHPNGSVHPQRDIISLDTDLMLNDLTIIERRLEKLDITVRSARSGEREAGEREQQLLQRCKSLLESETALRDAISDAQELKALSNFGFLSLKPMLVLLNLDEAAAAAAETENVAICAQLEAELIELSAEEAAEFRRELYVPEGAVARVLESLQTLLRLVTFFTAGEKETRAWTVRAGDTALQAAGRIHTDIERGFIRAEVIGWDRLLELGSHVEARKRGELRTEGKQYVVQEGDVINILFNV